MIVVTGATGNVGKPLAAALAAAGDHVVAVARRPTGAQAGVRQHAADLTEPASLKPALEGPTRCSSCSPGRCLPRPAITKASSGR